MKIRPLDIQDLDRIGIDDAFVPILRAYIEQHGKDCARVGEINGQPIFAAGVNLFWEGVGECWIRILDPAIGLGHAFLIIDEGKKLLKEMMDYYRIHRLQAIVRADDERTLRFDQFMGFEIECTMKEYFADRCDAVILRYREG